MNLLRYDKPTFSSGNVVHHLLPSDHKQINLWKIGFVHAWIMLRYGGLRALPVSECMEVFCQAAGVD
ncbi:hypothetical protein SAMN04488550_4483 [Gordonia malaquae]|nr:hypothetical protein SAMN04488550_4483 [Gordonia malaquae]